MTRNFPISAALIVGFGSLIAAAVGATLWVSLSAGLENALRLIESTGNSVVRAMVEQVEGHLEASANQAAFIAELIKDEKLDPADEDRLHDILLGSLAAAPGILAIAYADKDGDLLAVGRDGDELVRVEKRWREDPHTNSIAQRAADSDVAAWEGIVWLKMIGEPGLTYIQPVRREGIYLGFVVSVVPLRNLSRFVENISENSDVHAFIVTGSHHLLAHENFLRSLPDLNARNPLPDTTEVNDPYMALFSLPEEFTTGMTTGESADDANGKIVRKDGLGGAFFYRDVVGFGPEVWTFGVYTPLSNLQRSRNSLIASGLVGVAILGLAIFLAILLSRVISRPFTRFAAASGAIRRLQISEAEPLGDTYLTELNRAAGAYNSMLGALRWFEVYLPRRLVLRLLRQGADAVRSEERMVTVLFTDIVGFTNIASKLTPTELADLLNSHFALVAEGIEEEDGTIDKYIGDSIMAFWGAPDDQPDHAERAARATLKARRLLEEDNRQRKEKGLQPIRIRAGLHSGPAIVGNIGAPGRINYTLIGDTVNAAQRIEAQGKAYMSDEETAFILVSGETAALLGEDFSLEPLEEQVLRGRSESTRLFRLDSGPENPPSDGGEDEPTES